MKELNRRFYYLVLIALLMSCSRKPDSAISQGNNLLENGGFEQPDAKGLPGGWQIVPHHKGKGQAVADTTFAHSGRYSLKLKPNKKTTSEGFGVVLMLDKDALKGKDITISGFVRAEGITGNAAVCLSTDKENWIPIPKDTKGEFVPFSKTFSLSRSISKAYLLILVGGTRGTVWLDDLVVSDGKNSVESTATKPPETTQKLSYKNILDNSGFEDKAGDGLPAGWQVIPHHKDKGEAAQDDVNAYTGSYSLKISPNKTNDREGYGVVRMLNVDDVRGRDVTIDGFARVAGLSNNATILLQTDRANWMKLPSNTGGKFVPFSKTFSIAKSIPEAALLILVAGTSGDVWIDDLKVSIEEESSDSPKDKTEAAARKEDTDISKPSEKTVRLGELSASAAILFASNRDTGSRRQEIYAMDADGGNVTRITFTNKHHFITGIDHSRRYIITSRAVEDTQKPGGLGDEDRRSLWLLDLKTKKEICLTDLRNHAEGDSFSPDGQWIVFFMKLGDKAQMDIYKIRRDGSELTRLTNTPRTLESDPSWSNDGTRILFGCLNIQDSRPRFVLKTMDVTGGNAKTVYDGGTGVAIKGVWMPGSYDPCWSPDDQWIVFEEPVKDTGGNAGSGIGHIFKVKANGGGIKDLSLAGGHDDRAEYLPSYSQDGKSIVFGSIYVAKNPKDNHNDIFLMDANSGSFKRLTDNPANDMYPVWIPSGN